MPVVQRTPKVTLEIRDTLITTLNDALEAVIGRGPDRTSSSERTAEVRKIGRALEYVEALPLAAAKAVPETAPPSKSPSRAARGGGSRALTDRLPRTARKKTTKVTSAPPVPKNPTEEFRPQDS